MPSAQDIGPYGELLYAEKKLNQIEKINQH
jgi:hypothetical protein